MYHLPALVNVIHSQCAQTEDEENGYEHVVDGPDVADLKQLTGKEKDTAAWRYEEIHKHTSRDV